MITETQFATYILNVNSPQNDIRKEAETFIQNYSTGDPNGYVRSSVALVNSSQDDLAKFTALTHLRLKIQQSGKTKSILSEISKDTLEFIINGLTHQLLEGNNSETVNNGLAHCIGILGATCFELGDLWPTFLQSLFNWTKNEKAHVREASMLIFTEVVEADPKRFERYSSILSSIILSALSDTESTKIRLLAVAAASTMAKTTQLKKAQIQHFKPVAKQILNLIGTTLSAGQYEDTIAIIESTITIVEQRPNIFEDELQAYLAGLKHICETSNKTAMDAVPQSASQPAAVIPPAAAAAGQSAPVSPLTGLSESTRQSLLSLRNISMELIVRLCIHLKKTLMKSKGKTGDFGPTFLKLLVDIFVTFRTSDDWINDDEDEDPEQTGEVCISAMYRVSQKFGGRYSTEVFLPLLQQLAMSPDWRYRFVALQLTASLIESSVKQLTQKSMARQVLNMALFTITGIPGTPGAMSLATPISFGPYISRLLAASATGTSGAPGASSASSSTSPDGQVLGELRDDNPRIVACGCQLIGALCESVQQAITGKSTFALEMGQALLLSLLSLRLNGMTTPRFLALSSLKTFLEYTEREKLVVLVDPIVQTLLLFAANPHFELRNMAINAMTILCDCVRGGMRGSYCARLAPMLMQALSADEVYTEDEKEFQGNCMLCMAALLQAVGQKESAMYIVPFTDAVLRIFRRLHPEESSEKNIHTPSMSSICTDISHPTPLKYTVPGASSSSTPSSASPDSLSTDRVKPAHNTDDDARDASVTEAWTRIAELLQARFVPMLPFVIPPLVQQARKKVTFTTFTAQDAHHFQGDAGSVDRLMNDTGYITKEIEPGVFVTTEENACHNRQTAVLYLISYAQGLGPYFSQYVPMCFEAAVEILREYNDDNALSPTQAGAELIAACIACLSPVTAASPFHPSFKSEDDDDNDPVTLEIIRRSTFPAPPSSAQFALPPLPPVPQPPEGWHPVQMLTLVFPILAAIYMDEEDAESDERQEMVSTMKTSLEAIGPILNPASPAFASAHFPFGKSSFVSLPPSVGMPNFQAIVQFVSAALVKSRKEKWELQRLIREGDKEVIAGAEENDAAEEADSSDNIIGDLCMIISLLMKIYGATFVPQYRTIEDLFIRIAKCPQPSAFAGVSLPEAASTSPEAAQMLADSPCSEEADRGGALFVLEDALSYGGEPMLERIPVYAELALMLSDCTCPLVHLETTSMQNSFSMISTCARIGGKLFEPYVGQAIKNIESMMKFEEEEIEDMLLNIAKDNAVGALRSIMLHQALALPGGEAQYKALKVFFVQCLPRETDEIEARGCHDTLSTWIESNDEAVMGLGDSAVAAHVRAILSEPLDGAQVTVVDPSTKEGTVLIHLFKIAVAIVETTSVSDEANPKYINILKITRKHLPQAWLMEQWQTLEEDRQKELSSFVV
ncbi:uncharacterized protein MONOS_1966 [Monocercomonoides exilis]|uniref:uncharacterized protein n=1 Tax=Monocercomonoides exilis TaxID=2049356 RepID=UPI00355A931E|nr:hypothetical protein MONOS_1966 [Monocercomonoides exilis]|eukprot:MONOS_1966.1-p1 / transcript=MONOS_1966.1 / gene=MONOS_1966 / organism=Monocercomonoides_exilis_PA203 / gene_product=unspecified product / transcript_product=unspecified product / location=Mono_scaffold00038:3828-8645(+) / protein_length=1425 / sequence_SO=supercontig / SO=protein_coding / is_pseudo=false